MLFLFQTNMGDVLIALNPFTDLSLYGKWVRSLTDWALNANS